MSQKVFNLVTIITTSVCAVVVGVIEFLEPKIMDALIPSVSIVEGAIIGICGNFVIKDTKSNKK